MLCEGNTIQDLIQTTQSDQMFQMNRSLSLSLSALLVPAGRVLGPLRLPKLSAFDDAADHGGRSDKQVAGGVQQGGGHAQGFSEKPSGDRVPLVWFGSLHNYLRKSHFISNYY